MFYRNIRLATGVLRQFSTRSAFTARSNQFNGGKRLLKLSVFAGVTYFGVTQLLQPIWLEDDVNTIKVHSAVDGLPKNLKYPLNNEYELLSYGIREVSFLKFQVYALGLYICKDDIQLMKEILNSRFIHMLEHNRDLQDALNDPEVSNLIIKNLLSSGIRFTARICAIRNTDLSHLRDGFIRTIKNNPNYKTIMNEDNEYSQRVEKGLDEFRNVLNSVKLNAKKNSLVFLEIEQDQKIQVSIQTFDAKKGEHNEPLNLGTVNEPLITELLFESYLGAQKPLIKSVHAIAAETIPSLIK